jgi:hypothetical protein
VAIEDNETFRDGVITCITKFVLDEDTQDKIIEELQKFQDAEGSFGKEIAKRQCKNINFDPGMKNCTLANKFLIYCFVLANNLHCPLFSTFL